MFQSLLAHRITIYAGLQFGDQTASWGLVPPTRQQGQRREQPGRTLGITVTPITGWGSQLLGSQISQADREV